MEHRELCGLPDESLAPYALAETELCEKSDTSRHDQECDDSCDDEAREDEYEIGHRE